MAQSQDSDETFTNEFGAILAEVRQASLALHDLLTESIPLEYDRRYRQIRRLWRHYATGVSLKKTSGRFYNNIDPVNEIVNFSLNSCKTRLSLRLTQSLPLSVLRS